jgi:protein-tyrosine phosphatase
MIRATSSTDAASAATIGVAADRAASIDDPQRSVAPFEVLFVCTGNICRSPMAERLLQARIAAEAQDDLTIASAGMRAVVGHPMDEAAALVLRQHGGNPEGHVARQLRSAQIRSAGLVLAAGADHRDRIVREHPWAMRRVFTMREFVRLGAGLGAPRPRPKGSRLAHRVGEVAGRRGFVDPVAPADDDIGDPYGAPVELMQLCGEQISAVVDQVLDVLGLAPAQRGASAG